MANVEQHAESAGDFGMLPRVVLASLALSAGAVHLAMAPIHAPNSTTEAILFAIAGWAQILLAIGLMMRPSRQLLGATLLLNVGIIVGYIMSRTAGLPFGANPWEAEEVQAVDLMTTLFEAAIVLGAGVLVLRPDLGTSMRGEDHRSFSFETMLAASALPLVVLFATSVALADPDLVQHSHGDEGGLVTAGHTHGDSTVTDAQLVSLKNDRCDLGINPAAYWNETSIAGIDTLTGGENPSVDHNSAAAVQGSPELDGLIATQTTSKGEIGDAMMVLALAKVSDDVYTNWLRWLGSSGTAGHSHGATTTAGTAAAPDDNNGMGGHIGPQPWHAMTDDAQCEKLAQELALARATALKYPTVADVEAAGWRQVTPYVPGIAAHFMNFSLVDDKFEIDKPEMILYDGTDPDSHVVGLSYYIRHDGPSEPTQGFTGNNDHYHRHDALCVNETGVIGDSTTTEEECAARGGRKADGKAGWMSHAWVVPGCESPWGIFSGASPVFDSELPKHSGEDGGGCAGSGVRSRFDLSPGDVSNTPTTVGGTKDLASVGQ
jgi:hypothetical protein